MAVVQRVLALRLAVDFDLFLRCQHQPAFLHAGDSVGAEFGAVVVAAAHTDFNDEFGGGGVGLADIFSPSPHYGQIWFRFRIPGKGGNRRLEFELCAWTIYG